MGMSTADIGQAGLAASVLLAVALLFLPADASAGQCSRSERVDHRDAECLYAWWKNRGLFRNSPYHVSNQCSEYGKVVAKVDLAAASDRTLHLTDALPTDGDTRNLIRGIACCSDMGICNRSDVVTDEGCLARFRQASPAARNCQPDAATARASENYRCTITASCELWRPNEYTVMRKTTSITVPFVDLDDVQNCRGVLTRGMCRPTALMVRVSRARTEEAEGATLNFRVTLSLPFPETVTVRYRTLDRSAKAGLDYLTTTGVLAFAPGETAKVVSVPVLDDDLDEYLEQMELRISDPNVREALISRIAGIGSIYNTDPMPKAWIGRFGRTVADQVLDAVDDRMQAKPAPGGEADASGLGQPMSERELLSGTSFSLTAETGDGGFVSVWGRGAATHFAGREAGSAQAGGDVAVDGEVTTGLLGADWTHGRWTTGLVVTHSQGDGGYRGEGAGAMASTLTGVWPWTRYALDERLSLWGVAGYGDGSLTLEPRKEDGTRAEAIRTDLDLWMAAVGLRGVALDGGDDGVTLAVKTDAVTVRTASGAVSGTGGNLAAAEAEVTRLRLGLEGSRPFPLGDGSVLTPSMEIGLRHDGGDAETGFGAEIGAGIAWRDSERGLGAELRGRGLLAHEAKGFRERGLSASFTWDPETGDRGPRVSLTQTLGVAAQGGADALLERTTLAGLAANDDALQRRRLEARFGYGFAAFGGHFTATPEIAVGLSDAGQDYMLGWRMFRGGSAPDGSTLELALEARRLESTSRRNAPPEHAAAIRVTSRF